MLYTVCGVIVISFALIGIIDTYKTLSLKIYCPKINNSIMILPIGNNCENAEFIIRGAVTKVKWTNMFKKQNIICLDCGMTDETKEICLRLCNDYEFLSIMTVDELKEYVTQYK